MSATYIVVEVPAKDRADLASLLDPEGNIVHGHGLDGAEIATAVIALTPPSLIALRAWLRARVDQRKHATVVTNGRRLTGYTAEEVIRIISVLEAEGPADRPE